MGLIDFSSFGQGGGLLDFLGGLLSPSQAQAQPMQQPMQQQPPQPAPMAQFVTPRAEGLGRLTGAIGGLVNGGSPIGGLFNAAKTLATGELTDPQDIARAQMTAAYHTLQKDFGMTEPQARMAVNNPLIMKELAGAMVKPAITVGPSGDIMQQTPFGGGKILGGFPVSESKDMINSKGQTVPGFAIKPSLTNPSGSMVPTPLAGAPLVNGAAPPPAPLPGMPRTPPAQPRLGGAPSTDPTMEINPRQIAQANGPIVKQSPAQIQEGEAYGKTLGAEYDTYQKGALAAQKVQNTLRAMKEYSPQAYEGKAAPLQQHVSSLLVSFGMAGDQAKKAAASGDMFTALANQLVLDSTGGSLGNQISNGDRDFIANKFPELSQTAEGRKQLIEYTYALKQREKDTFAAAQRWKNQNGSMDGFTVAYQDWAEKNPIFPGLNAPADFNSRFQGAVSAGAQGGGIRILSVRPGAQ